MCHQQHQHQHSATPTMTNQNSTDAATVSPQQSGHGKTGHVSPNDGKGAKVKRSWGLGKLPGFNKKDKKTKENLVNVSTEETGSKNTTMKVRYLLKFIFYVNFF